MSAFKKELINLFVEHINKLGNQNKILVLKGAPDEILNHLDNTHFIDSPSFNIERGKDIFSKNWFTEVFTSLQIVKDYHLLSYSQFCYLTEYIDQNFFIDRVIIIEDNLRTVLPLKENEYFAPREEEAAEIRDENLPAHHIEHFKVAQKPFFIARKSAAEFNPIEIFSDSEKVSRINTAQGKAIDLNSDIYELDMIINELLEKTSSITEISFNISTKNPEFKSILRRLELLNYFLKKINIDVYVFEDQIQSDTFIPSKELLEDLKKYWGKNAGFRNISIYKNPQFSAETIQLSQGKIVELIIEEYKNARKDNEYRDILLTAPTGAGKSLLFQLPAFKISSLGDVTIVVSPLIALMQDQVNAIRRDRNFDKVAYLNSTLSLVERERVIEDCKTNAIDVLYMSPELLLSYDISFFIGDRKLGLLVIDEAHLITTWGRDFRVDYWFLGNHVRKMRVHNGHSFPMVAVTATAIYGGSNDMVFDTETSLVMKRPHYFIGSIKRENIEFLITNYTKFEQSYNNLKLKQTVDFIQNIITKTKFKTLVYAPYTSHVNKIQQELLSRDVSASTIYYGELDKNHKDLAFHQFHNGEKQVMISTKAFGMGIDIPDIQVVYHHAPSGLLPDYVQEVGRLARIPSLSGYAALNYSEQDKLYTNALHGMSALKPMQLLEILKKISAVYKKEKRQNLLISVEDFAHIFDENDNLDQKVLTALMMIEQDYIAKFRFNVLIARPKKLFVKTFAKVNDEECTYLFKAYGEAIQVLPYEPLVKKGYKVLSINLDEIWSKHFYNDSFPKLKYNYYNGKLFEKIAPTLIPQIKINYTINVNKGDLLKKMSHQFDVLKDVFSRLEGKYFSSDELTKLLEITYNDVNFAIKVSGFLLSNYAGRILHGNKIEENAFIGRRLNGRDYSYRILSSLYNKEFSSILSKMASAIDENNSETIRFVTNKDSVSLVYTRIGYFIELFELGTFEIKGGDNPMIFLRINDPKRIEKDSNSFYSNQILKKTLERHYLSNKIFDHFFIRYFTNKERWDFIEDFFLGKDIDELLEKYPGKEMNSPVDLTKELQIKSKTDIGKITKAVIRTNDPLVFDVLPDQFYNFDSLLTLVVNNVSKTQTVSKWVIEDPVLFDLKRKELDIKLDTKVFEHLVSKLRQEKEYFRDSLGLNMRIEFPKYPGLIKAIVPYKDRPVDFYMWWCENQNAIKLSFKEKIELFMIVNNLSPKKLKNEHKKIIEKT